MYSIKLKPELLKQLELKTLVAKKKFIGNSQGIHRSNKKGYGLEFADYRQYEPGDDPRHIDWGVFSRTEKLIVKTFQEELSIHFQIIVDSTNSMQNYEKLERGLELAGLLAYQAVAQNDSAQIILPGRGITPKISGIKNFYGSLNLNKFNWNNNIDNFIEATKLSLDKSKFPCVVIIISDFLYELAPLKQLLTYCQSRKFDCFGLQVLSVQEVNPYFPASNLVDSETGEKVAYTANMKNDYDKIYDSHQSDLNNVFKSSNSRLGQFIAEEELNQTLHTKLFEVGLIK